MMKYKSDDLFDWYEYELELDDEKVSYYFEVSEGKLTCVYDSRGVAKNVEEYYKFVIVPGNHVPRWAKV